MYTNSSISSTLSQEQLYLVARARRQPAVLPFSGVWVDDLLVLRQGKIEHELKYGVFNYWFLRDWASRSLGRECPEILDILPGRIVPYTTYLDYSLPSVVETFRSAGKGITELRCGPDGSSVAAKLEMCFEGKRVTSEGLDQLLSQELGTSLNLYRLFASGAYFDCGVHGLSQVTKLPFIDVPLSPFGVVKGQAVYKKSILLGMEEHFATLAKNGYIYRIDRVHSYVYYSNSLAAHLGYPPTATALGLPGLSLGELPGDWHSRVAMLKGPPLG
jgi:hypothetical protein